MSDPISVGIIGVGIHGTRYARHIQRDVPGLTLLGIYQRDEAQREAKAAELGTIAYPSAPALVEAADAVVIATPPPSHAPLLHLALDHDAFALVEKPVTRNVDEAAPILDRDTAAGGRIMVAQTLRYDGVIAGVRAHLPDVAPIHHIRMAQRLSPSTLSWQWSKEHSGGGSILLTGIHLFDTVSWFLNEAIEITHCETKHVLNAATEDYFVSVGRSESGVHVALEVSKYTTHRACFVEVVGEKGQLFGDYHHPALTLGRGNERISIETTRVHTVAAALRDFEAWMRGRIENPIPLVDGVRALALADQCYERAGG